MNFEMTLNDKNKYIIYSTIKKNTSLYFRKVYLIL